MMDWPPEQPHLQDRSPPEDLLRAIATDDHAAFFAALPAVRPDINSNKGQYLRAAADARNMLFMKELALAGADILYAASEAERERAAIKVHTYWDDERDDVVTKFDSAADRARHGALGRTVSTLQQFQKTYTEHIAPAESLKMQQRILEEIEALKREITEMRDGRPLDKPALRPHPPKATPEPGHVR